MSVSSFRFRFVDSFVQDWLMPTNDSSRISRRAAVLFGIGGLTAAVTTGCVLAVDGSRATPKRKPDASLSPPPGMTSTSSPVPSLRAKDFGVVGNGVVDDSSALQRLLDAAAAAGGIALLTPNSRIRVQHTINLPSNTRLNGNGAVLLNLTRGTGDRIFMARRVKNVTIQNLNLDGLKAAFPATTEQRHNLVLSGATGISLDRVNSYNAKGDGLYIGDETSGPCIDVSVTNCTFRDNHRQGVSITCVSGLTATNCVFSHSAGTAPQAGVDIEPNTDSSVIENIAFENCVFTENVGGGLLIILRPFPTASQESGAYSNCSFTSNPHSSGVVLTNSRGARFASGTMSDNGVDGMTINSATDTVTSAVNLSRNGRSGIQANGSYFSLTVDHDTFDRNGTMFPSSSFGLNSVPGVGHLAVGLQVINNAFLNMHGGVQTNSACSEVQLTNNQFAGVEIPTMLEDDQLSRIHKAAPSR